MPEAALRRPAIAADWTSSSAADAQATRWPRVLLVALGFFAAFYVFEHSAEDFAGGGQAETREDRIKDDYIDNIEAGSSQRKLIFVAYGLIGLAAAAVCRSRPWNVRPLAATLLVCLVVWAMLSVTSSYEPELTYRRLAATGLLLLGSVGFARMLRPNELLAVSLVTFALFVANSLLLDLGAGGRPWDSDYRFAGTLHPNIQAAYCGLLCLAAFSQPVGFGQRWITRSLLAFGLVMLVQTQSRTAVLAVLIGLMMVFLVRLRPAFRWAAGAGLASLASLGVMVIASLGDGGRAQLRDAMLLGRTEQAGSLTGRVPLWEQLSEYLWDRPLTGYGYETFWTPDRIADVMKTQEWALQSAHNGYLDFTLQLGLVGLALGVALVIAGFNLCQSAYTRTQAAGYAFAYGLFAFAMTNSLLESHFVKLKYPTVIALIALLSVTLFYPEVTDEPETEATPTAV